MIETMTLADLQNKLSELTKRFNKSKIKIDTVPLYSENLYRVDDVKFSLHQYDNGTYYVVMEIKEE